VTVKINKTEAKEQPTPKADPVVVDDKGRRLSIREPDILQESRLVRLMGDSSMNAAYMHGYVMPAVMVSAIDGVLMPFPSTVLEVEAAIQVLGRGGMEAVMAHVIASAKAGGGDAEQVKK
jgi:hypothetical protein